uniref:Uncharacterized protein n=1 Tax=Clastoptera arizonana TaxID=38151 RepID=A0A1B6D7U7_9HEMI
MLSGKVAFVTGGGSGIGRSTCQVLARDGAHVVVVDFNEDMAKETLQSLPGDSHLHFKLDVSDKNRLTSVIESVIKQYKVPPSIVANCAAIIILDTPLNVKMEDYDSMMDINVKGTLNVIQVTSKEMLKHSMRGSIVNIGSCVWDFKDPQYAAYAAGKAALQSITKTVACELGPHGIRCNVINPGF